MRKIIVAALLSLAAAAAGAQTLSEALSYSGNNYTGTARSMALGNAMTALGGDLGSIGINPAGSAVAPYSQFTISPGVTLLSNSSGYSTSYYEDYGGYLTNTNSRFNVPNIGFTMRMDTYNTSGLKSFSFGFVSNASNYYMNDFVGAGVNDKTSLLGSFAAGASPYSPSQLNNSDNYYRSSIPWNYLLAYQAGMIADAYDEQGRQMVDDQGYYTYLGTTEAMYKMSDGSYDIRTPGALDQYSRVQTFGGKYDLLMNFAMNFSDVFFLGFNIGMPMATYKYSEYFRESAVDPSLFEIEYTDGAVTNFSHATYGYSQTTDISGVYGKVGFIWLPAGGLRIGAAIQTPTALSINDKWHVEGATTFLNSSYNTSASSPTNEYTYNLRTPWHFNAGIAYTIGDLGLISADFEMTDYSSMRFSDPEEYGGSSYYAVENDINRYFAGKEYYARFGAEAKLTPALALRGGYTFKTSPQYYSIDYHGDKYTATGYLNYYDDFASGRNWFESKERYSGLVNTWSVGMGYSSPGAFFADVAFRHTSYPTDYFNPYSDYITGGDEYLPETAQTRKLSDIVMTIGWRF